MWCHADKWVRLYSVGLASAHGLWISSLNQTPAVTITSLAAHQNDLFFRFDVAVDIWGFPTSFETFRAVLEVKTQIEIQSCIQIVLGYKLQGKDNYVS